MATIGRFRPVADGYEGTISTLSLARKVRFVANDRKKGEKSPDFFVKTGQCDLGVAWREEAKKEGGQAYLSVLLDDPSFAHPINAALFDRHGQAELVWSRPKRSG